MKSTQLSSQVKYLIVEHSPTADFLRLFGKAELRQFTKETGAKYRVSPIFGVKTSARIPGESFVASFFFVEDSFLVIAEILGRLTAEQSDHLWFSHGLASIIYLGSSEGLESVKKEIKAVSREKMRATEEWIITKGKLGKTESWLAESVNYDSADFQLDLLQASDPEIDLTLDELRHCYSTAVSRAAQFLPSGLPALKRVQPAINLIIHSVDKVNRILGDAKTTLSALTAARQQKHLLQDYIVQLNAAFSYIISQAYSGIVPIGGSECQIRTFSLLGVGTAHNGLAAFTEFAELTFQKYPVAQAIRRDYPRLPGVAYWHADSQHRNDWKNYPEEKRLDACLSDLVGSPTKFNLPYFSGRYGFRETLYTITAPLQVLAAC